MVQRIAELQWFGFYLALATWALLTNCLLVALIRQKMEGCEKAGEIHH